MSKLIPMEEAAQMLGLSVDRLAEMRSNNEIFGYRDGTTWKFKLSEIERVADEFGITLGTGKRSEDGLEDDFELSDASGFEMTDSVKDLLTDLEDSRSDLSGISGIGGISGLDFPSDGDDDSRNVDRKPEGTAAQGDDYDELESVELMEDSSIELFQGESNSEESPVADSDSGDVKDEPESFEIELADSGILAKSDSKRFRDVNEVDPADQNVIDDDDELSFGSSSIRLASGSSGSLNLSDDDEESSVFDEASDSKKSPSDTGKMLAGEDSGLELSEEDLFSDELSLADSSMLEGSSELSSDFTDSGELILEDSDSSNEVRLEANESGIGLSANDSGIMLADDDDLLNLEGSDIDSLELADEEEDLIVVDSSSEDEFNLTPLADPLEDDDSTGSQVIALEDSEIYTDESADSLLGAEEFAAEPVEVDDLQADFEGGFGGSPGFGEMGMPTAPAQMPEAPYGVWNIVSLAIAALLMVMGSMIAFEACQNMWMPDEAISSRGLLSFFLRIAGM